MAIEEAKILQKPIIVTNYLTAKDQIEPNVTGIIAEIDAESIANTACCVPGKNHSSRVASSGWGLPPDNGGAGPNRTAARTRPSGALGARLGSRACKKPITAAQTGAAPLVWRLPDALRGLLRGAGHQCQATPPRPAGAAGLHHPPPRKPQAGRGAGGHPTSRRRTRHRPGPSHRSACHHHRAQQGCVFSSSRRRRLPLLLLARWRRRRGPPPPRQ